MKKNCNCDETEVCEVCAKNGCVTAEEKRTLRIEWVDTRASLTPYHKDLIHFQMQEYANEYANAKLLEALEKEVIEAANYDRPNLLTWTTGEAAKEYFETQVKPKYIKP